MTKHECVTGSTVARLYLSAYHLARAIDVELTGDIAQTRAAPSPIAERCGESALAASIIGGKLSEPSAAGGRSRGRRKGFS
jgi:hypothetical protein